MASARVVNMDGAEQGAVELNSAVFDAPENPALVHDVAVALQNARRHGNAETKTRKQVRGGGKKPYRQKGTGSARHGSTREPQMRGGGAVFGPHKRSYRQKVTTTLRRQALKSVLSDRVRSGALCVLSELNCEQPKTKPFAQMVSKLSPEGQRTLFITSAQDSNAILSARNLQRVHLRTANDLNALDVLSARHIVVVQDALEPLENRLGKSGGKKERQS